MADLRTHILDTHLDTHFRHTFETHLEEKLSRGHILILDPHFRPTF